MDSYSKHFSITFFAHILNLILGIFTSILIARILGPENKGILSLTILLPTLLITLLNFGIEPSTIYYIGKGKYDNRKIYGNTLIIGVFISGISILFALIIIFYFKDLFLKEVPSKYLFISLGLIPLMMFHGFLNKILLGLQKIRKYSLISVLKNVFFLFLIIFSLIILKLGVIEAILARILSYLFSVILICLMLHKIIGSAKYNIDKSYIKDVSLYGIKTHAANILAFLNYRLDMFLVNAFLSPIFVGYYSISVSIAEQLWLISSSASLILFVRVASEKDDKRLKEFTPVVSRNVLFMSVIGALTFFLISKWMISFLYSKSYLPSVIPFNILLPGIVALSVSKVLSSDIGGRGRPLINTYLTGISVFVNLGLNIIWIPKLGVEGAALASTVAYSVMFLGTLIIYCKISGNSYADVLIIRKSDFNFYKTYLLSLINKLKKR